MVKIFGDIPGVQIYFDDPVIAGKAEADHDQILLKTIERTRQNNVKFISVKTQNRHNKITLIEKGQMYPDNKHKNVILQMKVP